MTHAPPAHLTRDQFLSRWPVQDAHDVRDALLTAWGARNRGYHDLEHLGEVLAHLDVLRPGAEAVPASGWTAVQLAAWFHDAVYDAAPAPEARSAAWARRALGRRDDVDVEEVARLVALTTTHDPTADDLTGQLLCDADLAILGAEPERYARYTAGVRREYVSVPDADFAQGRAAILADFLERDVIFGTDAARRLWEAKARRNIAHEIETLTGTARAR